MNEYISNYIIVINILYGLFIYLFIYSAFFLFIYFMNGIALLCCNVVWNEIQRNFFRIYVHSYQVQGISTLLYENY